MLPALAPGLRRLARSLDRGGFPYAFIGGVAVNVWGEPRGTYDLDALVEADAADESRLLRAVGRAGFSPWPLASKPGVRLPVWSLVSGHKPGRLYLDLFLARSAYQYEALGRRRRVPFGPMRIAVLSPEDLLLHKLLAERPKDMGDVEGLLALREKTLDWVYLRFWGRRLGLKWPRRRRAPKLPGV